VKATGSEIGGGGCPAVRSAARLLGEARLMTAFMNRPTHITASRTHWVWGRLTRNEGRLEGGVGPDAEDGSEQDGRLASPPPVHLLAQMS
jgi:hypothetical protein